MTSRIRRSLASLALLLAPVLAAAAESPQTVSAGPAGPPATICPADDGVPAPDPRVEQSPAQAEPEAAPERADALSSVVEVRHPDGSVSVDLQEAFWSRVVMQRNADGSITIRCFPAGARVFLPLSPARKPLEEK